MENYRFSFLPSNCSLFVFVFNSLNSLEDNSLLLNSSFTGFLFLFNISNNEESPDVINGSKLIN